MQKIKWVKIGLAVVGSLALVGLVGYFMVFHYPKAEVCFNDFCWRVEVAKTGASQVKGLMFRKNLGEKEGMLFVFKNEGFHSFWLKNTLIPLDIVFLDKNKKVVNITENAQPCPSDKCPSYRNQNPVKYVLEIRGGLANKIGLTIDSKILFSDY